MVDHFLFYKTTIFYNFIIYLLIFPSKHPFPKVIFQNNPPFNIFHTHPCPKYGWSSTPIPRVGIQEKGFFVLRPPPPSVGNQRAWRPPPPWMAFLTSAFLPPTDQTPGIIHRTLVVDGVLARYSMWNRN